MCRSLVQATAPRLFTQRARNDARSVQIGDPYMVLVPTYGSPFIHNLDDGRRYATIEDFRNFVKLTYTSRTLHHGGGTLCEPVDLPVNKRHFEMVYSHIRYSDRAFMGSVTHPSRAQDSVDMARIVFGGEAMETEHVIMGLANANSPMSWDFNMLGSAKVYAENNQIMLITPFILGGAMAPVTAAIVGRFELDYDYEQLAALVRLGHSVRCLVPRRNRHESPIPPGVTAEWIRGRSIRYALTWSFAFFWPMLRASEGASCDLLRIHTPYGLGPVGLQVARLRRLPTVALLHHLGDPIPAGKWIEQRLLRRFDGVMCCSEFTAHAVRRECGVKADQVRCVYPGVDSSFVPGPADWGKAGLAGLVPEGTPCFLFVGALIARKNLGWLLDAFARYCAAGHLGHLVIAGRGPEEPTLRARSAAHCLEGRVHFLGGISADQQLALYRSASVFVFPSLMEGFGFAAAEALACGTPAIVSDRGSLPEVVEHERAGLVLSVDQGPQPWVEAMDRFVRNEAWRRQLGITGSRVVRERFTWEAAGQQAASFFLSVIRRHGDR
jgi:glycosyltransferase involved in cell wall biosynthesis